MSRFRASVHTGLVALLGAGLAGRGLSAQGPSPGTHPDRIWVSGGLGFGVSRKNEVGNLQLAAGLSANYQPSVLLFTLRSAGVWGVFEGEILGDVGLLVGVGTRARGSHASLALGPAIAGGGVGLFRSRPTSVPAKLGLGAQLQGFGIAFGALGLGISGFANFNSRQSFGGVTFNFIIGQLGW